MSVYSRKIAVRSVFHENITLRRIVGTEHCRKLRNLVIRKYVKSNDLKKEAIFLGAICVN